jgi:NADPH-dependent ferric siderophore reductase
LVEVRRIEHLNPHMARVTFAGADLEDFHVDEPAASVRLLLPSPGTRHLVVPTWNGNEFLLPDGSRPIIRTFTPRRFDAAAKELDLDIVLHEAGAASSWVGDAAPGDPAAVSGPGRGFRVAPDAAAFLLAGDQTAIPAICQLIEHLSDGVAVDVIIEVAHPDARLPLPDHPRLREEWVVQDDLPGSGLLPALRRASLEPGATVWAAGEAAAMHRVRRHLFEERGLTRADATVRGYWKHGR